MVVTVQMSVKSATGRNKPNMPRSYTYPEGNDVSAVVEDALSQYRQEIEGTPGLFLRPNETLNLIIRGS